MQKKTAITAASAIALAATISGATALPVGAVVVIGDLPSVQNYVSPHGLTFGDNQPNGRYTTFFVTGQKQVNSTTPDETLTELRAKFPSKKILASPPRYSRMTFATNYVSMTDRIVFQLDNTDRLHSDCAPKEDNVSKTPYNAHLASAEGIVPSTDRALLRPVSLNGKTLPGEEKMDSAVSGNEMIARIDPAAVTVHHKAGGDRIVAMAEVSYSHQAMLDPTLKNLVAHGKIKAYSSCVHHTEKQLGCEQVLLHPAQPGANFGKADVIVSNRPQDCVEQDAGAPPEVAVAPPAGGVPQGDGTGVVAYTPTPGSEFDEPPEFVWGPGFYPVDFGGPGGFYLPPRHHRHGDMPGNPGGPVSPTPPECITDCSVITPPPCTVDCGVIVTPPPTGAVPEPASWALMMIGIGGVGGKMRRDRAQKAKAKALVA